MNKMEHLKPQTMTMLGLMLVIAITVCAPHQALAQQKRKSTNGNSPTGTISQQTKTNRSGRPLTTDLVIDLSGYYAPSQVLSGTPTQNGTFTLNSHQSNNQGASAEVQQRNDAARRSQSGQNVTMANTEGDFHFAGPLDHAQGNGNLKTSSAKQRTPALGGDPDQPIVVGASTREAKPNHFAGNINWGDGTSSTREITNARQNSARFSERTNSSYYSTKMNDVLVSSYSKPKSGPQSNPKSSLIATTYGRGSSAKVRGKRGR